MKNKVWIAIIIVIGIAVLGGAGYMVWEKFGDALINEKKTEKDENDDARSSVVPVYNGGGEVEEFEGFELSKSKYSIISGATKDDFEAYTKLLAKEGFECFYETEVNGNLFETWTDKHTILTLSHISYEDVATTDYETESLGNVAYMSIAEDSMENCSLPARQEKVEAITSVQLTAVSTECGYVIRLSDGRFLIFDGGMPDQASTIYKILDSQNEREGKPIIAAWFLTHGHTDHIGAILQFVENYAERVEIETFVHNLPDYDIYNKQNYAEKDGDSVAQNLYDKSVMYYKKIEAFYPDAAMVIAHAGQRFEYGDIDVDVMYTTENLYKKPMMDTNMSSVIYSITGNGGRMIVLGDAQDVQCPTLNAIYGSTLKCDLIQVAHHGYNGGNAQMYANMNAKYAIWSNSYTTIIGRSLHIPSKYPRNTFDYKTVEYNIIPIEYGETIILREGMTKEELAHYNTQLTDEVQ